MDGSVPVLIHRVPGEDLEKARKEYCVLRRACQRWNRVGGGS